MPIVFAVEVHRNHGVQLAHLAWGRAGKHDSAGIYTELGLRRCSVHRDVFCGEPVVVQAVPVRVRDAPVFLHLRGLLCEPGPETIQ